MGWDEHMVTCNGCGEYDCECSSYSNDEEDKD